jgi:acetate kinase
VVHGGTQFAAPCLVNDAVLDALRALIPMARSHQPHNIAGLEAARAMMPEAAQVACFDTSFHRTVPEHRQLFAIPHALSERGIRRYGFHGLSYEAIAEKLPEHLGEAARGRVIILHLGNGSSACGLLNGASQATSMGFTPLDGLMMGNRPGHIDAGVILYLLREEGLAPAEISDMLYRKSGLLGVSGLSSDMRVLQASDDPAAKLAITMYVDRVVQEVGLIAAALGGIDALVFTAGIGENSAAIRAATLDQLDWLGFSLDAGANATNGPLITRPDSNKPALVLKTDEEGVIARETARVVGLASS